MSAFTYTPVAPFSSAIAELTQAPAAELLQIGTLIGHEAFGDEAALAPIRRARDIAKNWPTKTRFSGDMCSRLVYIAGRLQRLKLQYARHRQIDWVERAILHELMLFVNDELDEGHLVFTRLALLPETDPQQRIRQIFDATDAAIVARMSEEPRPRRPLDYVPTGCANARFRHNGLAAVVRRPDATAKGFTPIAITVLDGSYLGARALATIQGFRWIRHPQTHDGATDSASAWDLSWRHELLWGEVLGKASALQPEAQRVTGHVSLVSRTIYIDHITTTEEVARQGLGLCLVRALIQECAGEDVLVAAFLHPITTTGGVTQSLREKLLAYAAPLGFHPFRHDIYLQHVLATREILASPPELEPLH